MNESDLKVYINYILISVDKKLIKLYKKVWMIQEQGTMINFSIWLMESTIESIRFLIVINLYKNNNIYMKYLNLHNDNN